MNGPAKLGAFAAAAVLTMGGAAAVGALTGPFDSSGPSDHSDHSDHSDQEATMPSPTATLTHDDHRNGADRYLLQPAASLVAPDRPGAFTFKVLDPAGEAVTAFDERHERPMHLILVSTDLTTYAHLHPTLGADGTWTATLPALAPGGYRLIADTVPTGASGQVLTTDLLVPGPRVTTAVPEPSLTTSVDGFEVDLDLADAGEEAAATFTVHRDGSTVLPDPYLGARGHLVAIDADDLGYLHVHPDGEASSSVGFAVGGTTPGRYRLFFDFSVDGRTHTAAFTVDLGPTAAAADHSHEEGHR